MGYTTKEPDGDVAIVVASCKKEDREMKKDTDMAVLLCFMWTVGNLKTIIRGKVFL